MIPASQALSDAESSSVEPRYYSTYRELQIRISSIPTLKSTEVVGCLWAACWLLVGCVPVWEILNCDRTRSNFLRTFGHGKGRVQNLNSNPEGM